MNLSYEGMQIDRRYRRVKIEFVRIEDQIWFELHPASAFLLRNLRLYMEGLLLFPNHQSRCHLPAR